MGLQKGCRKHREVKSLVEKLCAKSRACVDFSWSRQHSLTVKSRAGEINSKSRPYDTYEEGGMLLVMRKDHAVNDIDCIYV
jgi:hypothetical protein